MKLFGATNKWRVKKVTHNELALQGEFKFFGFSAWKTVDEIYTWEKYTRLWEKILNSETLPMKNIFENR